VIGDQVLDEDVPVGVGVAADPALQALVHVLETDVLTQPSPASRLEEEM
jgi:hypothetical protein